MAMPDYMARLQRLAASAAASGCKADFGMAGSSVLQQQQQQQQQRLLASATANWPYGMDGRYVRDATFWLAVWERRHRTSFKVLRKDWRDGGDWLCSCGFRNYSSRAECKECSAPVPSGISSATVKSDTSSIVGIKRLASEELGNDWHNKRLNPGNSNCPLSTAGSDDLFFGIRQGARSSNGQTAYSKFESGSSMTLPPGQAMPGFTGKGHGAIFA